MKLPRQLSSRIHKKYKRNSLHRGYPGPRLRSPVLGPFLSRPRPVRALLFAFVPAQLFPAILAHPFPGPLFMSLWFWAYIRESPP
jgi:hypothetical protein